ncbi:Magnetic particle membrane-associated GTPase P16 (PHA granule-associate protein, Phasin family) [Candidatus Defluviicoccus seviourii]|uniref:Magnetic particle membrane-associated GTPase P16 (PHA granule-associate protein, Phasin family) n=2 Tax=root TaxID=1 RepID=A0A564WBN7_9PROT|nr:Magnetic particle membrane-associated GTPase P16 (PHA granule-associate protein, Phasin family) [uncultured Defluviicoccus sp.]VUX45388.1 Magnetic particle membrane-associated GTPase P16 (PHA granule-associate protein, Phasin family) [Candidatus Defluviicoccus seviourii]
MANGIQNLFDVTKYLKDFNPTKMVEEFSNAMKQYRLPGVNIEAVVESQKKNLEALTSANRVAFEGLQAVAKRQAEILQETMNEASKAVDSVAKAGSPPEMAAKQLEIAKQAFDKAIGNMRELAEMVAKANEAAASTVNTRISATLDEIKELALNYKQS